jgi:gamma-glutamyltranspeptidase/glutathione hydrolase
MVSAGHSGAATAGLLVLEAGGNAVDAGVAAGLVLGVVQSDIVNIAGVAPIMVRSGATHEVVTIDGLGTWPAKASAAYFREVHGGAIPVGLLRTVIPAAPAAWIEALKRFGTMSFGEVAASAIGIAREGFLVNPTMADFVAKTAADYQRFPQNAALYLPGGLPLHVGSLLVQPELAATLAHMADEERQAATRGREAGLMAARDAFYKGDIASCISSYHSDNGGWLTQADLAGFEVNLESPVVTNWRGATIYNAGPWCQGPVLAQILTVLGDADLKGIGHNSADYIHLLTEAMKLAFADREAFYGDPRFVSVPLDKLLSPAYGAVQRARIDMRQAIAGMPAAGRFPAEPPPSADTSYVAVVDRWGNAFSATPSDTSNDTPLIPGTGLCPSSRGSQSFTIPGHPSEIAPGKRPRLTPNPAMAVFEDGTVMPFGSPGGDVQTQSMLQVLLNLMIFDHDLVSAIEAPRFATYSFPSSFEPHEMFPDRLMLEGRIPQATVADLRSRGHDANAWPDFTFQCGGVCAVLHNESSGLKIAAADPRRNSGTAGW